MAPSLAQWVNSSGIRLPAYKIKSAVSSNSFPFTLTNSASPGPAPTMATTAFRCADLSMATAIVCFLLEATFIFCFSTNTFLLLASNCAEASETLCTPNLEKTTSDGFLISCELSSSAVKVINGICNVSANARNATSSCFTSKEAMAFTASMANAFCFNCSRNEASNKSVSISREHPIPMFNTGA